MIASSDRRLVASGALCISKILLVIGDAAEVLDTMYPLFRLREEGGRCRRKRVYHLVQMAGDLLE
jgi:hypothetical protein